MILNRQSTGHSAVVLLAGRNLSRASRESGFFPRCFLYLCCSGGFIPLPALSLVVADLQVGSFLRPLLSS